MKLYPQCTDADKPTNKGADRLPFWASDNPTDYRLTRLDLLLRVCKSQLTETK
jgi:hypothetical protein